MWNAVTAFPVFTASTIVLLASAVLSALAALTMVITARPSDVVAMRGAINVLVGAAVSAFAFALLAPEAPTRHGDIFLGSQWQASVVSAAAVAIVLVGVVRESKRRQV